MKYIIIFIVAFLLGSLMANYFGVHPDMLSRVLGSGFIALVVGYAAGGR